MKKKVLMIIGIIIILLAVIYGMIFLVDYICVSHGKLPVLAQKIDSENYNGLGYRVTVKYHKNTHQIEKLTMFAFGKTIAGVESNYLDTDNDPNIIIIEDGKIQNENLLDTFLKNADNNEPSTLQINNTSNGNTETITLEYVTR